MSIHTYGAGIDVMSQSVYCMHIIYKCVLYIPTYIRLYIMYVDCTLYINVHGTLYISSSFENV